MPVIVDFLTNCLEKFVIFENSILLLADYEQSLLGACQEADIACCVATHVVSHKASQQQIVIDCGFLGISHDGFAENLPSGPCLFKGEKNLR